MQREVNVEINCVVANLYEMRYHGTTIMLPTISTAPIMSFQLRCPKTRVSTKSCLLQKRLSKTRLLHNNTKPATFALLLLLRLLVLYLVLRLPVLLATVLHLAL